ncbi:DNA replication protein DnaC [Bradyrhizobium sp. USDA 328]
MQFTTAKTLVAGLAKAHGERHLDEKLVALSKPKLLIVDELDYLPLNPTLRICSSGWSVAVTKPAPC